ncbi:MAG: DUF4230 domain-containing protein [Clostridiales bacterium]|nr:DUF4230 domain-containing protein [Clostridiales bacterium]
MADHKKNVNGMEIESSAKTLDNERSKKQKQALKDLKAKSSKNEDNVKKQRAKSDSAKSKKAKDATAKKAEKDKNNITKETAVTAGAALIGGLLKKKTGSGKKKKTNWLMIAIIGIVAVIALVIFWPQINSLISTFTMPSSIEEVLPDEVMGYNSIDFQNAILGEARQKQELIVMEQDVQVDSTISNVLANIALFKKTKVIHTFGTGVYTVDMSKIDSEHITVDEAQRTVTVSIPHTVLQYVNVDVAQTTFEETEHNFIKLGDIKLTQEQQKILDESIDDVMREKLNTQELFDLADEFALLKVQEIFQPLVSAVSEEFLVVVIQE